MMTLDSVRPTLSSSAELDKLIEKAFVNARALAPYWSIELAALKVIPVKTQDPDFTVAVTDAWHLIVAESVLEKGWSAAQLGTVFLHELVHVWNKHGRRAARLGIVPNTPEASDWNAAADAEINDDLDEMGVAWPTDPKPIFAEQFNSARGLTAEEYFEAILDWRRNQPKPPPGSGKQKQPSPLAGAGGCGSGAGNPSEIEEAIRKMLPNEDGSPAEQPLTDEQGNPVPAGMLQGLNASEADDMADSMDDSLIAAEGKTAGKVPGSWVSEAKRRRKPVVDWRAMLRQLIRRAVQTERGHQNVNWSKFSRRQYGQFLQPSFTQPVISACVVLDTSGSMSGYLDAAKTEIAAVCEAVSCPITWMQVDAEVQEQRQLRKTEVDAVKFRGGGGTDFRPAFAAFEKIPVGKRPQIFIYLTDGYGPAPVNPPGRTKVIWAMLGGVTPPAPWGASVLISE